MLQVPIIVNYNIQVCYVCIVNYGLFQCTYFLQVQHSHKTAKSKIDCAARVAGVTDSKLQHMRHVRVTQSHSQALILLVSQIALGH